ncbi:MAG: hypothetical protein M0P01_05990 [Treponema sp.]|nr:hypothetical protein [Treponema sp.]
MTLGATLYVKNSTEAAAFYCDAFGMNIGYNARNDDGTYLHAERICRQNWKKTGRAYSP